MRRVGFFGGTFDPVHRGHLEPARAAMQALELDGVVFVPAGSPPHKQGDPLTAFSHRLAMLVLATQDEPGFFVSDLEAGRAGPTYTVDSVPLLRTEWPAEQSFFLLGSDSLAQLTTWHRWEALVDMIDLVVLHRDTIWGAPLTASVPDWLARRIVPVAPGQAHRALVPGSPQVFVVEHPPVPAAATDLRAQVRRGLGAGELVPPSVARYIDKYSLYRQGV
ncbi:MAG TPA: nicotinate-nucleotide adenylyltransferase [Thermoanaerobaculaceae bacterium]|mgnify:CR=1 FL=1|nr:nicotinate-nucleotide adenylyltransferase [Thermoanaerobaculaceae bacterium]HPS77069.1 nicotinate-nucleotide adenylyltransferase [Thermoanaerobaculaceae bacterium]